MLRIFPHYAALSPYDDTSIRAVFGFNTKAERDGYVGSWAGRSCPCSAVEPHELTRKELFNAVPL